MSHFPALDTFNSPFAVRVLLFLFAGSTTTCTTDKAHAPHGESFDVCDVYPEPYYDVTKATIYDAISSSAHLVQTRRVRRLGRRQQREEEKEVSLWVSSLDAQAELADARWFLLVTSFCGAVSCRSVGGMRTVRRRQRDAVGHTREASETISDWHQTTRPSRADAALELTQHYVVEHRELAATRSGVRRALGRARKSALAIQDDCSNHSIAVLRDRVEASWTSLRETALKLHRRGSLNCSRERPFWAAKSDGLMYAHRECRRLCDLKQDIDFAADAFDNLTFGAWIAQLAQVSTAASTTARHLGLVESNANTVVRALRLSSSSDYFHWSHHADEWADKFASVTRCVVDLYGEDYGDALYAIPGIDDVLSSRRRLDEEDYVTISKAPSRWLGLAEKSD